MSAVASTPAKAGEARGDLVVKLTVSKPPRVGETAIFTCTVSTRFPDINVPTTQAVLVIPKETDLVAGVLQWEGDVTANAPAEFAAQLRFTAEGDWAVNCYAKPPAGHRNTIYGGDGMVLTIGQSEGKLWVPGGEKPGERVGTPLPFPVVPVTPSQPRVAPPPPTAPVPVITPSTSSFPRDRLSVHVTGPLREARGDVEVQLEIPNKVK